MNNLEDKEICMENPPSRNIDKLFNLFCNEKDDNVCDSFIFLIESMSLQR